MDTFDKVRLENVNFCSVYNARIASSLSSNVHFYRPTRVHSADDAVARCLSIRLSVCLTVSHTPVFCLNGQTYLRTFFTVG